MNSALFLASLRHEGPVNQLMFLRSALHDPNRPSSKEKKGWLISASSTDRSICVWDLDSMSQLKQWQDMPGPVAAGPVPGMLLVGELRNFALFDLQVMLPKPATPASEASVSGSGGQEGQDGLLLRIPLLADIGFDAACVCSCGEEMVAVACGPRVLAWKARGGGLSDLMKTRKKPPTAAEAVMGRLSRGGLASPRPSVG